MHKIIFCSAICLFSFSPLSVNAANTEDTVKISAAGGALCKSYADALGYDSEKFIEFNILTINIADKMGYTKDFYKYQAEINDIKSELNKMMENKYGSKDEAYKDWCVRFYDGFKKSIMANM